jgi:hypothetical protein
MANDGATQASRGPGNRQSRATLGSLQGALDQYRCPRMYSSRSRGMSAGTLLNVYLSLRGVAIGGPGQETSS